MTQKTAYRRVEKFVQKHKVALAVGGTIIVMGAIYRVALKQHDDFLKEHDLYEEYYTPEEADL